MSGASVSIDRTSLGKAPLVIADDGATYRFTGTGVGHVIQSVRTTSAPDSADVGGSEILAFVREAASLPLEFYVIGASSAAVDAAVAEMDEALFRLEYPATRTVDGVAKTWSCGPCALVPTRAYADEGVVAAHFETYSVTIPIPDPIPGA